MGGPQEPGGLQLAYDAAYERKEWFVQRAGWILMLLIAVAAMGGFFGKGAFNGSHAGKIGSDLYIQYDHFIRHQSPFTLKVFCRAGEARQFSLAFDRAFLERLETKGIQPRPVSSIAAGDKCVFNFLSSGNVEQLVSFSFVSDAFGSLPNEVRLNDQSTLKTKQFIWP